MQVDSGVVIGGKYVVERLVARGGMGAVWAARHVRLGHVVAVKFLDMRLARSPEILARFEREARAAANLDTPHVVRVHDYGIQEDSPYLVMEMLNGQDLAARLRERGRLSLFEASDILIQMGRALRRAHEVGVVHRDLKPANVFLCRTDAEDEEIVKILDFGIAKETSSRLDGFTKPGEVLGSPHYMSPEQAAAERSLDHRTDVWSTGVIVYRMLTGRLPFTGEGVSNVIGAVLALPFPPVARVAPELPPALEGFFEKALAKKKEERFASIAELVDAFTAITGYVPPRSSRITAEASTLPFPAGRDSGAEAPHAGVSERTPTLATADVKTQSVSAGELHAPQPAATTQPSIANVTTHVASRPAGPQRRTVLWALFGFTLCAVVAVQAWLLGRRLPEPSGATATSPPPAPQPDPGPVPAPPAITPPTEAAPGSSMAPAPGGTSSLVPGTPVPSHSPATPGSPSAPNGSASTRPTSEPAPIPTAPASASTWSASEPAPIPSAPPPASTWSASEPAPIPTASVSAGAAARPSSQPPQETASPDPWGI